MKTIATTLMCACMALAAGSAAAADEGKKVDKAEHDGMSMSTQECRDHMAKALKAGEKKDAEMMKKDGRCAEMLKKAPTDPMKK